MGADELVEPCVEVGNVRVDTKSGEHPLGREQARQRTDVVVREERDTHRREADGVRVELCDERGRPLRDRMRATRADRGLERVRRFTLPSRA